MTYSPEHIEIAKEIMRVSKRLEKASKEIFGMADTKAEAEREYRKALAKRIMELRAQGLPATICSDVARGEVADLKFNRDLSDGKFKAAIESLGAIKVQASMMQTIHKRYDNI